MNIGRPALSRRGFLQASALGASTLACSSRRAHGELGARPNVLFIICDDLNDTVDGMGGHPQARTPNIDRLMKKGVRFSNAHCNAPICGPSRASLWTGLYPCVNGYYGYAQQANRWRNFPAMRGAVTMMEHFKAHGYGVYGSGKVFHNGHEDDSVFTVAPAKDNAGPSSFGPVPWDGSSFHPYGKPEGAGHPSMPPDMRSDYWGSFAPLDDVPTVGSYSGWMNDWNGAPWSFRYDSAENRDPMPDELTASWASTKLRQSHMNPFFMICGINRPHVPRYAPKEFFDMFPVEDIQLPPYLKNDTDDCARILIRDPITGQKYLQAKALDELLAAGDETSEGGEYWWKKWIQSYLACVAFADHQIGKILDALEESVYVDNTIVVLTGDHGYHMGEKNHMHKTTIWEESTRVPFVVYAPGVAQAGARCEQPVSLIDCYPTLNDLCSLPENPNAGGNGLPLNGHSIRPFLVDPVDGAWDGPDVALNHLHGPEPMEKNTPSPISKNHHSVRSRQYRYTRCCNGEEELYDHHADPNEWTNLAANVSYASVKTEHREKLEALLGVAQSRRNELK